MEEMNDWERELLQERFTLCKERLSEMVHDEALPAEIRTYFDETAGLLMRSLNGSRIRETVSYDSSFANPSYAEARLGKEFGALLSLLYYEMASVADFAGGGRLSDVVVRIELFLEFYSAFLCEWQDEKRLPQREVLCRIIYWYVFDYSDVAAEEYVKDLGLISEGMGGAEAICLASESILYRFLPLKRKAALSRDEESVIKDHKEDMLLILDKGLVSRRLEALRTALERFAQAGGQLRTCPEMVPPDGKQHHMWSEYYRQAQNIVKKCIAHLA